MFEKILLALRQPGDIAQIVKFLKNKNEKPALVLLYLVPSDFVRDSVVSFETASRTNDMSREIANNLTSFDYELVEKKYDASFFPATIVSKEALERKCEAIFVLSRGDKGLFEADFASSIVLESTIPVLVIRN